MLSDECTDHYFMTSHLSCSSSRKLRQGTHLSSVQQCCRNCIYSRTRISEHPVSAACRLPHSTGIVRPCCSAGTPHANLCSAQDTRYDQAISCTGALLKPTDMRIALLIDCDNVSSHAFEGVLPNSPSMAPSTSGMPMEIGRAAI